MTEEVGTISHAKTTAIAAGAVAAAGFTAIGVAALDDNPQQKQQPAGGDAAPHSSQGEKREDHIHNDRYYGRRQVGVVRWGPSTGKNSTQASCHGGAVALSGGYKFTPATKASDVGAVDVFEAGPVAASEGAMKAVNEGRPYPDGWRVSGDHNGQEVIVKVTVWCG